jgi:starch synthase
VPLNVCLLAAELAPFAKTGGLGDVVSALGRHLHRRGHDVRPFLPLYGNLKRSGRTLVPVRFLQDVPVRLGDATYVVSVQTAALPGSDLPVYFVECPPLYGRNATYSNQGDEHLRFAVLARAGLDACQRMGFAPDVVHCHDWHTALAPLYLKTAYAWDRLFARTRTVLTIHNLAYQGVFPTDTLGALGLAGAASRLWQDDLREGRVGFLRTGLLHADVVTTVSRTYAREIMTPEHGLGLDAMLRARARSVVGIVNGIDAEEWNPAADPLIPHAYSPEDLSGKARNKEDLLRTLGLAPAGDAPVLSVVSRLTAQKGFDLIFEVLPDVLSRTDARFVALGTGSGAYEARLRAIDRAFPGRARFHAGYSNELAHRIEAGADVFLMPSLFEPCGLNQMYSQRYGTVPIVRRTGGLADTVDPYDPRTGEGTGFVFDHYDATGLRWAIDLAMRTWRDRPAWTRLQRAGMAKDFSWDRRIEDYEAVYAGG